MKILKKLIIPIILILAICIIAYLNKDYLIRQYFIHKIESVDYDEYIITRSVNGKKTDITYYTDDCQKMRTYDSDEELENIMIIYDYNKHMKYEYNVLYGKVNKEVSNNASIEKLNNDELLNMLKDNNKNKFKYLGTEIINGKCCYTLCFELNDLVKTKKYLDKELLYIVREETNQNLILNENTKITNHIVKEYNLDFKLTQKELFEMKE